MYEFDTDAQVWEAITIEVFRAFLNASYELNGDYLSFRSVVGLYSRIWGKGNLNVKKPLHIVSERNAKICILDLIKLFDRFDPVAQLEKELDETKEVQSTFRNAYKNNLLKKINASTYKENKKQIEKLNEEIVDIQENLAKYMVNVSEILNREQLELRDQKNTLLESQLVLAKKLNRVRDNLAGNKYIKSKKFESLKKFFPNISIDRIASVEEFHSDIVKFLRSELKASEKNLSDQLEQVDAEISKIDGELAESLAPITAPSAVIDRVVNLERDRRSSIEENRYYEDAKDIARSAKEKAELLIDVKSKILKELEVVINDELKASALEALGVGRKSPMITLGANSYEYVVSEDTGTGTAYNALVLFDLAILKLTRLPILIHDSPLFKNIENDSLGRIFTLYSRAMKQTFIAIDEMDKYGSGAADVLSSNLVAKLGRDSLLYTKDWRNQTA